MQTASGDPVYPPTILKLEMALGRSKLGETKWRDLRTYRLKAQKANNFEYLSPTNKITKWQMCNVRSPLGSWQRARPMFFSKYRAQSRVSAGSSDFSSLSAIERWANRPEKRKKPNLVATSARLLKPPDSRSQITGDPGSLALCVSRNITWVNTESIWGELLVWKSARKWK